MDVTNSPATGNKPLARDRTGVDTQVSSTALHENSLASDKGPEIRIGKTLTISTTGMKSFSLEVFTMTLAGETIELLPLKNWRQLDHYKWTVRGKLPTEPPGLEIAVDHVKIAGQTASVSDPAGCARLEHVLNLWLQGEKDALQLARKKTMTCSLTAAAKDTSRASQALRFCVEVDKRGQVHIHSLRGKETLASVGLTVAGLNSLCRQGLMRRPHTLQTGALHDWVELDGQLCSFEKGRNDTAQLEQLLNLRYLPAVAASLGNEVVIFANAASSTGFDIEFSVQVGGVAQKHRQHLNDESLELLQDPHRCGLLQKEIIIKLIPPNLVFKRKTADGGEHYLSHRTEHLVALNDEEDSQKIIDLSQPLNLLRLSAAELNAVFNHPSINQHAKAVGPPPALSEPLPSTESSAAMYQSERKSVLAAEPLRASAEIISAVAAPATSRAVTKSQMEAETLYKATADVDAVPIVDLNNPPPSNPVTVGKAALGENGLLAVEATRVLPNLWLKDILVQPPLRHDWFACLVYTKIAEWFGNSTEGRFGPASCWFVSLTEVENIQDPEFKGIFLTEKGSLGFLNQGQMARFYNGVAFIGPQESALEGIGVDLIAVGLDGMKRVVFILSDDYRAKFGLPKSTVTEELDRMRKSGVSIMSSSETLACPEPLDVVWTVPTQQADPNNPEALESIRPG